jgi:hypothetical protein
MYTYLHTNRCRHARTHTHTHTHTSRHDTKICHTHSRLREANADFEVPSPRIYRRLGQNSKLTAADVEKAVKTLKSMDSRPNLHHAGDVLLAILTHGPASLRTTFMSCKGMEALLDLLPCVHQMATRWARRNFGKYGVHEYADPLTQILLEMLNRCASVSPVWRDELVSGEAVAIVSFVMGQHRLRYAILGQCVQFLLKVCMSVRGAAALVQDRKLLVALVTYAESPSAPQALAIDCLECLARICLYEPCRSQLLDIRCKTARSDATRARVEGHTPGVDSQVRTIDTLGQDRHDESSDDSAAQANISACVNASMNGDEQKDSLVTILCEMGQDKRRHEALRAAAIHVMGHLMSGSGALHQEHLRGCVHATMSLLQDVLQKDPVPTFQDDENLQKRATSSAAGMCDEAQADNVRKDHTASYPSDPHGEVGPKIEMSERGDGVPQDGALFQDSVAVPVQQLTNSIRAVAPSHESGSAAPNDYQNEGTHVGSMPTSDDCNKKPFAQETAIEAEFGSKLVSKIIVDALWSLENAFRRGYAPDKSLVDLVSKCPESEEKKECCKALRKAQVRSDEAGLRHANSQKQTHKAEMSQNAAGEERPAHMPSQQDDFDQMGIDVDKVQEANIDALLRKLSQASHSPHAECLCAPASTCSKERLRAVHMLGSLASVRQSRAVIMRCENTLHALLHTFEKEVDAELRKQCGSILQRLVDLDAAVTKFIASRGVERLLDVCAREEGYLNAVCVQVRVCCVHVDYFKQKTHKKPSFSDRQTESSASVFV